MSHWLWCSALALAGCIHPAPRQLPLGYTTCAETLQGEVTPYAFIRLDALAGPEGAGIIAHELSHIAVLRSFKSCREYERWRSVRGNAARLEAMAFCAAAHTWTRQTLTPLSESVDKYALWLSLGYPAFRITQDEARSLIVETCQP